VNKKNSKPLTTEDYIARGGFTVSRMRPDTIALIESVVGDMYTLRLVDPAANLVEFYSSEEAMRHHPPRRCYFLASWMDRAGLVSIPDWVVKDGRMLLQFSDANYLCHPVRAALLEGPNWKYEVISP